MFCIYIQIYIYVLYDLNYICKECTILSWQINSIIIIIIIIM